LPYRCSLPLIAATFALLAAARSSIAGEIPVLDRAGERIVMRIVDPNDRLASARELASPRLTAQVTIPNGELVVLQGRHAAWVAVLRKSEEGMQPRLVGGKRYPGEVALLRPKAFYLDSARQVPHAIFITRHRSRQEPVAYCGAGMEASLVIAALNAGRGPGLVPLVALALESCLHGIEPEGENPQAPFRYPVEWLDDERALRIRWFTDRNGLREERLYRFADGYQVRRDP
jgi:hypothetical protein